MRRSISRDGRRTNRKDCGDGELLNLRHSLASKEGEFSAALRLEEDLWPAYKEALSHFKEISNETEGNPQEIKLLMEEAEELSQKLNYCKSNQEALTFNVNLQQVYEACTTLKAEVKQAEDAATACKASAEEATAKRRAAENALLSAKREYDKYFIAKLTPLGVPASMTGLFEIEIDKRTNQTHAQLSGNDLPGRRISFRSDGSVVESTVKSCMDHLSRDLADDEVAAD